MDISPMCLSVDLYRRRVLSRWNENDYVSIERILRPFCMVGDHSHEFRESNWISVGCLLEELTRVCIGSKVDPVQLLEVSFGLGYDEARDFQLLGFRAWLSECISSTCSS